MRPRLGWITLAVAITVGSVTAQAPRPAIGPARPWRAPAMHEGKLENGCELTFVPWGRTPLARIEIVVRAGAADDPTGQVGVAELVGEVLEGGSTTRNAAAIATRAAELGVVGGDIGIAVRPYETIVSAEVLSESAPELIALMGEVVRSPAFDPATLPRLQSNLVRHFEMRQATAANLAAQRANALLFPGHPADRQAPAEEIRQLTFENARQFHADHFVGARTRLYVAGRFDLDAVERAAHTALASLPAGNEPAAPGSAPPAATVGAHDSLTIHLIDRRGATQARIQISAPIVDPAHPDHSILNQMNLMLGSMQTSRIIANVRERHGYSYNISSRLVRRPGASQWAVMGDVATGVTAPALREILAELTRITAEPPPGDELLRFQTFLLGALVEESSTPAGILEKERYFDLYGIPEAERVTYMDRVREIGPLDIQRVARTFLAPERLTIVVVGDRSLLAPELASIGRIVD